MREITLSRLHAEALLCPVPLPDVLDSLQTEGVIAKWKLDAETLRVWSWRRLDTFLAMQDQREVKERSLTQAERNKTNASKRAKHKTNASKRAKR